MKPIPRLEVLDPDRAPCCPSRFAEFKPLRLIITYLRRLLRIPNPEKTDTIANPSSPPDRSSMADFVRILHDHDRQRPDRDSTRTPEEARAEKPEETREEWREDVRGGLSSQPAWLSLHPLILREFGLGHRFHHLKARPLKRFRTKCRAVREARKRVKI